jgi:hypothetical protein
MTEPATTSSSSFELTMTEQHPLTDEICDKIQDSVHPCDPDNMRAAADWQLEQVIEWLKDYTSDDVGVGCYVYMNSFSHDLRKAMRPTIQEDN